MPHNRLIAAAPSLPLQDTACGGSQQTSVTPSLQRRLRLFALGCGAVQATVVEQSGLGAELVMITRDGQCLKIVIIGPPRRWHEALDRMERLYDEKSDAGLSRFLGLQRAA